MQEALENALAELALGRDFAADDPAAVQRWLHRHGVSSTDAEYLTEQGLERLLTYRRLVRGNLREAIEVTLPRVVARLGSVFDEYFDRFLAECPPRTHYLRDVSREFLEFCVPLWAADPRVPAYLIELADHEALEVTLASLRARPVHHCPDELSLDAGVAFIDACRVVHYEHAIHEISEAEPTRAAPPRQSTWLFVYRSPEHAVRTLKLTPLAATLLYRLIHLKETLRQAVTVACEEHHAPLSKAILERTAALLGDLSERGALLGKPAE